MSNEKPRDRWRDIIDSLPKPTIDALRVHPRVFREARGFVRNPDGTARDLAAVEAEVRNALVPARHHLGAAHRQFSDDIAVDLGDGRLDRLAIVARALDRILGMATEIAAQVDADEEHSCGQCGWSGTGHHGCPGLPGENEW